MEKDFSCTDMAVEFCSHKHHRDDGLIKYYEVTVDEQTSSKLGKPCGKYATLETSAVVNGDTAEYARVTDALSKCLKSYCKGCDKVMAVGLGNPDLTADALGDRVFKRLSVNRHLSGERAEKYLCALTPNVLGMTGIESFDIISAVADRVKPDVIVVVDALTAAAAGRIATAFQVTDSGITPGSGVENHRRRLDKKSLGFRTVSVGVPLVVYASTIVRDYCNIGETFPRGDMIVTPKDVDILVDDCAKIISGAINSAFSGSENGVK